MRTILTGRNNWKIGINGDELFIGCQSFSFDLFLDDLRRLCNCHVSKGKHYNLTAVRVGINFIDVESDCYVWVSWKDADSLLDQLDKLRKLTQFKPQSMNIMVNR